MTQNAELTIYQKPGSRGQAADPAGFTKAYVIPPGDTALLAGAVAFDNCPARYKDGYRTGKNFEGANAILGDTDNGHSENPDDWVTHQEVAAALTDVAFYSYPSRNHMKPKDGKALRPKEHHIFPVGHIASPEEYAALMKRLIEMFPALHFDPQVKSPAQLNFGVENPQVSYIAGNITLDSFLKNRETRPLTGKTQPIPAGQRNSHMSHFAGRVLKKYGDADGRAYQTFADEAAKCSPPLSEGELSVIWNSAKGFLHKSVEANPGYQAPSEYAKTQNLWALPLADPGAMAELSTGEPKYRKLSIAAVRLFLKAFGLGIKLNDMSKRAEIEGLPPEYSGEDACNLLEKML